VKELSPLSAPLLPPYSDLQKPPHRGNPCKHWLFVQSGHHFSPYSPYHGISKILKSFFAVSGGFIRGKINRFVGCNPIGGIGDNRGIIGGNSHNRGRIGGTPGNRPSRAFNSRPCRDMDGRDGRATEPQNPPGMGPGATQAAAYRNPHSMRLVPNFFYSSQATPNPNRAGCFVLKSAECVEAYP
jgi:hypothetical protein